jgi:DNA-directed RNA polymerase specialized sigma24 family protein
LEVWSVAVEAADYRDLSFEEIAKKLGVDFSKAKNKNPWLKECREVFDREREA